MDKKKFNNIVDIILEITMAILAIEVAVISVYATYKLIFEIANY